MRAMKNLIPLCVLLTFFLLGCAAKTVRTSQYGSPQNCQRKLLIASQQSDFKNSVVEKMTEELNTDYCYLKQVDVAYLEREPADQYQAIAILNTLKWMSIEGEVQDYLDQATNKEKIVVLTTTGKEGRVVDIDEVDAVSSASTPAASSDVAGTMVAKVRQRLASD